MGIELQLGLLDRCSLLDKKVEISKLKFLELLGKDHPSL